MVRLPLPLLLAVVVAVPLVALVAFNTVDLVTDLMDPCRSWGHGDEGPGMVRLDDECPARSGTSMTRVDAVLTRVAIDGLLLFGAVAGVVGARRDVAAVVASGAAALLFVSVPLSMGLFGLPIVALAVVLFLTASLVRRGAGTPASGRSLATGSLAAVLALAVFHLVVIPDANPFFLVGYPVALVLGGAAVVSMWPRRPADGPDAGPPPGPSA